LAHTETVSDRRVGITVTLSNNKLQQAKLAQAMELRC
jgi:hypothetical protein